MTELNSSNTNTQDISSSQISPQTTDSFGIGKTQGQRKAELVAALRAEFQSSAESRAMSKSSARIAAGVMIRVSREKTFLNYLLARPVAFRSVIEARMPKGAVKIVEIAAGLSTRSLHMARALPNAEIVEVDLPDVVADKQQRYAKAGIEIPENLSWKTADLGVTPLWEVLEDQQADIIVAEGLTQYYPSDGIERIARNVLRCLTPGGFYICDFSLEPLRKYLTQTNTPAARLFIRQAGAMPGILANEQAGIDLLHRAGYETVEVLHIADLTASIRSVPKPFPELSVIFCGQKHKA
jgi:O-methyltransferase involved in polyketide biosynthesis